ncbi:ABC transporter substrate-binding protein, partial [Candidatus Magnetomorum sp. HK-1]
QNTFDLLCDLNPQIKESVNILSISQPFISFVTFFRRPLDEKISTMFKNAVNSMLDYEEGRQMMMLFNIEGIQTISDEDVANVANLLNEYELLKK